ncbi:MAG TPA: hypothetical protein VGP99_00510 [Tepidisphaeraceae bacterium]|jgi:hypothetical protein|nr:hypothetical protein [Tepidisphaeraceae bacterium]
MGESPLADFRRYAGMIAPILGLGFEFSSTSEGATAIQVERGSVLPLMLNEVTPEGLARVGRLIEVTRSGQLDRIAVIDRLGHHRPIYRPLLVYAWLSAFALRYEDLPQQEFGRWEEGLRAWCDLLEAELGDIGWDQTSAWAARGSSASEACWIAVALQRAGKVYVRDVWIDLASDLFGKLAKAQQPSGAFLEMTAADSPEARWFDELAILHAATAYAAIAEDRTVAAAVKKNTEFHLRETQPDHATSQPFGLFAFIWNEATRSLADQMLNGVSMKSELDGVTPILLADVMQSLRLFGV